jgi:predicted nucleic acid-binding protein
MEKKTKKEKELKKITEHFIDQIRCLGFNTSVILISNNRSRYYYSFLDGDRWLILAMMELADKKETKRLDKNG